MKDQRGIGMVVLGIVAIIAVIGLVLMFSQQGAPSGRLINPDPYTTAGGKSGYGPGAWESGPVRPSWTATGGGWGRTPGPGSGAYIGEGVPAAPPAAYYQQKYAQPSYPVKSQRGISKEQLTYPYT